MFDLSKRIVQHRHCLVCKKVCPPDKETCSEECEADWNKQLRKRRMYYYLLWAMMAVFVAVLLVQLGIGL